ncbi:MAG: hypothetical protein NDF54_00725 [archaeon GB-1867-035]|nr:hypothetical protein [Candidatus Culexmicrobium profundum]
MKHSFKVGMSFGSTSGIITTLGLMVGLHSGTHSKLAVIGGILTIAVADAFSDALGIHMSEEAEAIHTVKEVWEATIFTFIFKFIFSLTFMIPVLIFELTTSIIVSIIWGLFLLSIFSLQMAREQGREAWKIIGEHVATALMVVILAHYIGDWISITFG